MMDNQQPLILNLCPTGMVPHKKDTPSLPVTPKEIAKDVKRCYELGVSMVHLHARDIATREPTWDPKIYEDIIGEIKVIANDVIIIVSTSGRNWQEFEKRSAVLDLKDELKPDMASLTLGSMNFPKQASINSPEMIQSLLMKMNKQHITPELEAFEPGMIHYSNYLIKKELLKPPYYYNILLGSLGTSPVTLSSVNAFLDVLPENAVWALAGIGRYQLLANTLAISLGGHVRVGLEDAPLYNWNSREEATNPKLVERILRIAKEFGREPASPKEARDLIWGEQQSWG